MVGLANAFQLSLHSFNPAWVTFLCILSIVTMNTNTSIYWIVEDWTSTVVVYSCVCLMIFVPCMLGVRLDWVVQGQCEHSYGGLSCSEVWRNGALWAAGTDNWSLRQNTTIYSICSYRAIWLKPFITSFSLHACPWCLLHCKLHLSAPPSPFTSLTHTTSHTSPPPLEHNAPHFDELITVGPQSLMHGCQSSTKYLQVR